MDNFVKIKVLPENEEQIINLNMIKRIKIDSVLPDGEKRYLLIFSGTDLKISESESKKIFEIIGKEI